MSKAVDGFQVHRPAGITGRAGYCFDGHRNHLGLSRPGPAWAPSGPRLFPTWP